MSYDQAVKEFAYNRVEEIMLSSENKSLNGIFQELHVQLEKLGIKKEDCDGVESMLFGLIDVQNQLIYRQGLSDAVSFLASTAETRHKLGI